MSMIIKHIEMIKRMDQLIRMEATGAPEDLASRLQISKTKVYRIIKLMRQLNAPVEYDFQVQSFVYAKSVDFHFGFFINETDHHEVNAYA